MQLASGRTVRTSKHMPLGSRLSPLHVNWPQTPDPRKSAASPSPGQEGHCVSAMLLGDQLPDLGHQIVGNIHDGLGRLYSGFILRQRLVFGLFAVVGNDPLYLVLIPSVGKFVLAH